MSKILKTLGVVAMGLVTATGAVIAVPQTREKIADILSASSPKYQEQITLQEKLFNENVQLFEKYNEYISNLERLESQTGIVVNDIIYHTSTISFSIKDFDTWIYNTDSNLSIIFSRGTFEFYKNYEVSYLIDNQENSINLRLSCSDPLTFKFLLNGNQVANSVIEQWLETHDRHSIQIKTKIVRGNDGYIIYIDLLDALFTGRYETADGKYYIDFDAKMTNCLTEAYDKGILTENTVFSSILVRYDAYVNVQILMFRINTSGRGGEIANISENSFEYNGLFFTKITN